MLVSFNCLSTYQCQYILILLIPFKLLNILHLIYPPVDGIVCFQISSIINHAPVSISLEKHGHLV